MQTHARTDISPPFSTLWLLLLVITAAIIGVHGVGHYDYNADEMQHVSIAGADNWRDLLKYSVYETHPPLGYLLRHGWMKLSLAPAWVRGFSLLCQILLILIQYRLGASLHSRIAGLAGASLVVFSYGCIIQSFVVRDYTLFLVFLSLAYGFFLRWRNDQRVADLLAYGIFGASACLTHFSGILAIFAMAAFHGIEQWHQRRSLAAMLLWGAVNLLIAAVAALVLHIWQSTLGAEALHQNFISNYSLLFLALALPVNLLFYLAPSKLLALAGVLAVPLVRKLNSPALNDLGLLLFTACGVGIAVIALGIYPFGDSRHNLWLSPFVLPVAGAMIANMGAWISERPWFPAWPGQRKSCALLAAMFAIGLLSYSPATRFADTGEYTLTQHESRALADYLGTLDKKSLIITERADAFLIDPPELNLYQHMDSDHDGNIAPFGNSRILFRTVYNHYDGDHFLALMNYAVQHHQFDGVENLIFVRVNPTRSAMVYLTFCPDLAKQVKVFSDQTSSKPLQGQALIDAPAVALVIRKQDFVDLALAPNGKAYHCLHGQKI